MWWQGAVNADEFLVFKPALKKGRCAPIISKKLGSKEQTMVYSKGGKEGTTINRKTALKDRNKFVLSDEEVTKLGIWALEIENHYERAMDIEWAKDGESGELFIVQARPETVHSGKEKTKIKEYKLKGKGKVLTTGTAIGEKVTKGVPRSGSFFSSKDSDKLQEGRCIGHP